MDDLLEFGKVQRGLLGIRIGDVNARLAQSQNLPVVNGVFVSYVNDNSSAQIAGIEQGDVIIGINEHNVTNVSELQELVARNRPGDEITVKLLRGGIESTLKATLRNTEGTTEIVRINYDNELEGAIFEEINDIEGSKYNLKNGVKVIDVKEGKWKASGLVKGFIITHIDKINIADIEDLHVVLKNKKGGILVEGIDQNGETAVLGVNW
jgi:serine protease Do